MLHIALVAVVVSVFALDDAPNPPAAGREAYEAARQKAGKDPAALVKLAIWCEAHGLKTERAKHLSEAVALDPGNRAVRGLLGQVSYRGEWLSPADFQAKQLADAGLARKLEDYHARRAQLEESLRNKKTDGAGRRKAALEARKAGGVVRGTGTQRPGDRSLHDLDSVQSVP